MKRFVDDVIDHKEDDIEKIQTKPNMYISYLGQRGSLHLSKEIINNAIDEVINPNSPGDEINIYLDELENVIMVSDNGRGIPFDGIEISCTKLQAGSKFTREGVGASAGENGVGMTAVNALSDRFEIIVERYGEKAKIKFTKGKLVAPLKIKNTTNKEKHGTTVTFQPSPYFMGEDCGINGEALIEWIEKIIYLVPSNVTIIFDVVNRKGKEVNIHKKYRNKNGLYDYIKKLCKKPLLDPIHFMKSMKIKEEVPTTLESGGKKEVNRFIGLEVAFTYDSNNTEIVTDSFCNFINTIDNGVHVDAVKTGMLQYLTKQTKDSLSEKEASKIDILFSDASNGLVLTVYLSTDMQPQFASQTKEKLSNNEFFKPLKDMTYRALDEYFRKNNKELKKIIDYIKVNAKARIEANKARNSVIRGETNSLDEHRMKNFVPANNKLKHEYRELFLIEGESALGSARLGRFDNDTQALFSLQGVPLNSYGLKLDKVLLNKEFFQLVKVLGCNIGDRFDITKLKYNKIIIMTDGDIDGRRITSLICVFFLCHLPELVKRGYLYKAVTPLYKIVDNKKPFIMDKQEYIEVFERRIRDIFTVVDLKDGNIFSNKKMKDFLLKNRDYLEELHKVANHFAINPLIIEFITIHYNSKNFKEKMKKRFPELSIDSENVLTGIYEGKYQILIIDKIFEKRISTLKDYVFNVNEGNVYFHIFETVNKNKEDRGKLTLGEFMTLCQKFQPKIETRYKGLGELQPDQLEYTTLNPENRVIIQLTLDDVKKEMEKFKILHGDSIDERRMLMEHFKISMEDLDN